MTALGVLAVASVAMAASPQPRIVASWSFDQAEGAVLRDVSGNGHDGKIVGARWCEGKRGGALHFDGEDDYVEVPAHPAFDLLDAMTIEVWARLESVGKTHDRVIVARSDHPLAHGGWNLDWGYGTDFWWGQDGEYHSVGRIPASKWAHIVLVSRMRGHHVQLYVNGKPRGRHLWAKGLVASEFPLLIGRRGQGHYFYGEIDELRVYDGALIAAEVAARFEGKPLPPRIPPPEPPAPPEGARLTDQQVSVEGAWDKPSPSPGEGLTYRNLFFALANLGDKPLQVTDIWLAGEHLGQPEIEIGDTPAILSFAGTDPSTIPPGTLGVLNLKCMMVEGMPEQTQVILKDASGAVLATVARFASPPATFATVAFNEDLKGAWVCLRGRKEASVRKLSLPRSGVEVQCSQPSTQLSEGRVVPFRLEWSPALEPGTPVLIRADTSAGPCFTFLRAYPASFPVGMYRVQRQSRPEGWQPPEGREWLKEYLGTLAVSGKETGQAPDEWLEDCRRHLIDTLVPDYVSRGGDPSIAAKFGLSVVPYGKHVGKYAKHPAVAAWYAIDEPGPGVTPARFLQMVEGIRAADPTRPVVVTINPPVWPRGVNFDFVDIGYQDTYPVPGRRLDTIAANVALYRDLIAPKPVCFIPQCFRKGPNYTTGWSRFPTPEEERFMVFCSLAAGARGMVYFAYNVEPGEPIEGCGVSNAPEAKALWEEIGKINLELRTLAALLARSCFADSRRHGDIEVARLLVGDEAMVCVILNHDFEYSRQAFKPHPKDDVRVACEVPWWLRDGVAFRVDSEGIAPCGMEDGALDVGRVAAAAMTVVTSDKGLRARLEARREELARTR